MSKLSILSNQSNLSKPSKKSIYRIWGLNSGTSCDGLDLCLVEFEKERVSKILFQVTLPYPQELQKKLRENNLNPGEISAFNTYYSHLAAGEILRFEKSLSPDQAGPFIGSHGHTLFHHPNLKHYWGLTFGHSFQIGCSETLRQLTGKSVIANFRAADIAEGGQGAPLSSLFDQDFFQTPGEKIFVQNIGGISNFTYLDPPRIPIASDSGPGNILIDLAMEQFYPGHWFDEGGKKAQKGTLIPPLLEKLMAEPYYDLPHPKSTGRELYNRVTLNKFLEPFFAEKPEDIIHTLTVLTALTITSAYRKNLGSKTEKGKVYLYGGGLKNHFLISLLKKENPNLNFLSTQESGVPPDFKEAITFAYLALKRLKNGTGNIPEVTGAQKPCHLGHFAIWPSK